MDLFLVSAAAAAAFCGAASYFDLRSRIVPNRLNLAALALGIALNVTANPNAPIDVLALKVAPLVVLSYLFSYLLYRVGAWGGGDAKFFTALSSYIPLFYPQAQPYSFVVVFLLSAALTVPVLLVVYARQVLRLKREFMEITKKSLSSSAGSALFSFAALLVTSLFASGQYALLVVVAVVLVSFLVRIPWHLSGVVCVAAFAFNLAKLPENVFLLVSLFVFYFAVSFARKAFGVLSAKVLTKSVPVSRLREGDIVGESVFGVRRKAVKWQPRTGLKHILDMVRKNPYAVLEKGGLSSVLNAGMPSGRLVANSLRARGVLRAEIVELKRLGVKSILVKESLPFTPIVSAGFVAACALWGLHAV